MKDSGVAWLGEIPTEWRTARIVRVARLESGHTPSRQVSDYWKPSECTIPWFSLADVWQLRSGRQEYLGETAEKVSPTGVANSSARVLPKGTVVLSRTASVGFSGIMPVPMATTQDFANWVCGELLLPEYLLFVLRSMKHEFEHMTQGSTHQTIYMPDLKKLAIPIPPKAEQEKIVSRIRACTVTVDTVLAAHERNLDLLAERRRTLTSSAVTRGLDTMAPMRDSGFVATGLLPQHWRRSPLKHLLTSIEQGWSPQCEGRPASAEEWGVLKVGCVNGTDFDPMENKLLPKELDAPPGYQVHDGDLLMSRANTRELVGSVAIAATGGRRLLLCDKLYRIKLRASLMPEYVSLALRAPFARTQIEAAASGASASMVNISQDIVRELQIPVPPVSEQRQIVAFIREHAAPIDDAAEKTRRAVELLREYRQSLITAAVTGRLGHEETH